MRNSRLPLVYRVCPPFPPSPPRGGGWCGRSRSHFPPEISGAPRLPSRRNGTRSRRRLRDSAGWSTSGNKRRAISERNKSNEIHRNPHSDSRCPARGEPGSTELYGVAYLSHSALRGIVRRNPYERGRRDLRRGDTAPGQVLRLPAEKWQGGGCGRGRERGIEPLRAAVPRVIALGASAFAFELLAAASGYLLYHYNCNEMLRDVTGSARACAREKAFII